MGGGNMVVFMLKMFGTLSAVLALIFAIATANILTGISGVAGGLLLIGFGQLLESVQRIEQKLLGGALTDRRTADAVHDAAHYRFRSTTLELPDDPAPLVELEGRRFIETGLLGDCVTSAGRYIYIRLPGWEEMVFERQLYRRGEGLFEFDGRLFVALDSLGLRHTVQDGEVWLEQGRGGGEPWEDAEPEDNGKP